ncbi:hypothetical protein E7T09_19850 [Deinococcus sp. KSM4-11]|uniref:hypothetical protein n=1 Tax=Deinococcus sp. KSM4-11 TaxID=2568654 RepID=UPI0010A54F25|nr:hypothetical protein [Deinococcus sp. KSM4-11]THF84889.1 hypothetical protein E7T09_19850 [Deinococcus sp. KSM4-11]
MTERTASGRAQGALKAIGMDEPPVSVLEREDALFILTPKTLVYQDGGGTRRVTLRDLTRIHSDEQGVLRVETPAGTALTATLLGFDVAQVQAFFVQVRDTTARAKEQPVSPLPTAGGQKTFGTAPAVPAPETPGTAKIPPAVTPPADGPAPARPPAPPVASVPATPTPAARAESAAPPPRPAVRPEAVATPAPVSTPLTERGGQDVVPPERLRSTPTPTPAPAADGRATLPGVSRPSSEAPSVRPVVISSSAFTPSTARTPTMITEPARGPERAPAQVEPPVAAPVPVAPSAVSPTPPRSALDTLVRQAAVVEGLTGRLRFLGGVLFVAALGLAAVQYTSGARLDGLWTLLSGGVGTIALLALADMARLLALSAHAQRQPASTDDDT